MLHTRRNLVYVELTLGVSWGQQALGASAGCPSPVPATGATNVEFRCLNVVRNIKVWSMLVYSWTARAGRNLIGARVDQTTRLALPTQILKTKVSRCASFLLARLALYLLRRMLKFASGRIQLAPTMRNECCGNYR